MKTRLITAAVAILSIFGTLTAKEIENNDMENLKLTQVWDKKFPQSDKVNHRKVTFKNRFGIELAADLYEPKNNNGEAPALAVAGPFGAVKEQVSGRYAQAMAERGFITLAFDPSFTGESGGTPRNTASPDINTEDFSAAVDYLTTLPEVDADRIGIIGICGWGGMALNAAAIDTRVKSTVTVTMYNMSEQMHNGYRFAPVSAAELHKTKAALNAQPTHAKESRNMPAVSRRNVLRRLRSSCLTTGISICRPTEAISTALRPVQPDGQKQRLSHSSTRLSTLSLER